ncbi:MAG: hypothetical protein ACJ784_02980 [Myxococcales bacterium]
MVCPSCGTDIPDDLPECVNCGLVLMKAPTPRTAQPVEGLERTRFDEAPDVPVERLAGLEPTAVAHEDFPPPDEPPLDIERTQVESPPGAASTWEGSINIERTRIESPASATPTWEGTVIGFDRGRESDETELTPLSGDESVCVWCGASAKGVFCDACGHRRAAAERPAAPEATVARDAEAVLCPACFARRPPYHDEVRGIDRCGECGMPLPPRDV